MQNTFSLFNIELTNHCIMKCVMCPRTNSMTRPLGYMDFDLFKKAIDELVSCNPSFCGNDVLWLHHFGESLLHPEFGRFIAYAASKNVRTGLSVNPFMLKEPVIDELVASGLYVLYISLDGHDDHSFSIIRGMNGGYGPSLERLMNFLQKKAASGSRIITILSMIDFSLNRQSIENLKGYWGSIDGIDSFLVKSFTAWDGSDSGVNAFKAVPGVASSCRERVMCSWPFKRMTVTWDGDLVPCCFDYNKKYVLGNLKHSTLAEIWSGERMELLRHEFKSNRVTNPLCVNCERLYTPENDIAF